MRIHYGGTHEYIKRSDVGYFLFLSCAVHNYMGDVLIGLIAAFMLYQYEAHWVWWVFFGVLVLGEWCEVMQTRGVK